MATYPIALPLFFDQLSRASPEDTSQKRMYYVSTDRL